MIRGLLVLCLALAACKSKGGPGADPAGSPHEQLARDFVERMGKGDFAGAAALGKDHKLPPDQLRELWKQRVGDGGAYQGIAAVESTPGQVGETVVVTAQLAGGRVDVLLHLLPGENVVHGLFIDPLDQYQPAPYIDRAQLGCHRVSFGPTVPALRPMLCMPKGAGPFPLLALVGGSGPEDRDEHIGKMWPFRDLAEGLASRGIAVLRWDKRTYGHLGALAVEDLTIKEEYRDDLVAALAAARATAGVDAKRIFLLGHSEGGWLIPLLMQDNPTVAGGILLAGHARPFASLIPAQQRYIAMLDGTIDLQESFAIGILDEQAKHSLDPELPEGTPVTQVLLGVYPKYWRGIARYDAPKVAQGLTQPLLILQGGRDYQVTAEDDLALWKTALAGKANVETEVFPTLNHVFVAGAGKITPAWVTGEGHVDAAVIERIAGWIAKH